MQTTRIQNGQTERITITALDDEGLFIIELGSVSGTLLPTIEIKRESDGKYLDFNDNTFKSSGWITRQYNMSELDSTNSPGVYYYDFNTFGFSDDNYFIRALNDTAYNSPFEGELKVGGFIDNIDASINSIKLKTDNLPSDPADQSAVESAISTSEANIRGTDSDTLKILSDQLDVAQADLDYPNQYKADVSGLATESNATLNTNTIVSEVNANETKIDSIISTLSTLVADIWGYGTRTLTAFGTLASDVWSVVTRTLTGIGTSGISSESNATANKDAIIVEVNNNETKIDTISTNVSSVKSSIESATYGLSALKTLIDAIDTSTELTARFDEIKGSGWTTETLKNIRDAINTIVVDTDWTVAERKQIRDALGIDGLKTTAQSGQLQTIKTETDKIQTIDNNLDTVQILATRILGLQQENFRILNPVYNTNHLLTSATIRIYNSASDCTNDVTPLASYTVTATYNDDNEMLTYKVTKN